MKGWARSSKLSLSHFHFDTFTFTLSLSHFHTFTFTLSLSHADQVDGSWKAGNGRANFHFHTFTLSR